MNPEPVLSLLARCPEYLETPLDSVESLATVLDVATVWVKDESQRMGLGSFKALGGAYAIARSVALGGPQTFCCASAGNHGLSVAAGAQAFGSRAVIFLPSTAPEQFVHRIRSFGAVVNRVGATYEESMAAVAAHAQQEGWVLVSDSSWPGYLEIPRTIMEGYTVIAWECDRVFREKNCWPTHVFLQAGVGGLAAAVTHQIRHYWEEQPKILVVEPDQAACLAESHRAGRPLSVSGGVSNMGRLDCKEPSLLAFDILHRQADEFITISDDQALESSSLLNRKNYPTTPSGAAGLAGAMTWDLKSNSRVLVLVTEGPEQPL